jgi:hypothetical protein
MLTFKPFDSAMYEGFAGVSSPVPMYAEDGDEFLFILDGDVVELYDEDGSLVESCESVSNLPY